MADKYLYVDDASPVTIAEKEALVVSAGAGSAGQIVALDGDGKLDSSVLPSIGGGSPLTTKGDLYTRDSSDDARLAAGADRKLVGYDSAETTGLRSFHTMTDGYNFTDSGLTSTLTLSFDSPTYQSIQAVFDDIAVSLPEITGAGHDGKVFVFEIELGQADPGVEDGYGVTFSRSGSNQIIGMTGGSSGGSTSATVGYYPPGNPKSSPPESMVTGLRFALRACWNGTVGIWHVISHVGNHPVFSSSVRPIFGPRTAYGFSAFNAAYPSQTIVSNYDGVTDPDPTWQFGMVGNETQVITSSTSLTASTNSANFIRVANTSGTCNLTLPYTEENASAPLTGKIYVISVENTGGSVNILTSSSGGGTDLIYGADNTGVGALGTFNAVANGTCVIVLRCVAISKWQLVSCTNPYSAMGGTVPKDPKDYILPAADADLPNARVLAVANGISKLDGGDGGEYLLERDDSQIEWFSHVNPASTLVTVNTEGTTLVPTLDGTETSVNDDGGRWINHATTTIANSLGGWSSATFTHLQTQFEPTITMVIKTGPNAADVDATKVAMRHGVGASDLFTSTSNSAHFAFGGTDTTLYCRSVDSGGTAESTNSTITLAANTKYVLKIKMTATSIKFYVNGVLRATHSTNLPTSTQGLNYTMHIRNTEGVSAKNIRIKKIHCRQN